MKSSDPYGFDPVLTSRVRLAILTALISLGKAEFMDLTGLLKLSKGNLSVHGRKLEEAGYLEVKKKFVGRKPQTTFQITVKGRRALEAHVRQLKRLIEEG